VWVAESQYEVIGTRFGVRFDDRDVQGRVNDLLASFLQPQIVPVRAKQVFALAATRPGDDRHHAYRDCTPIVRSGSWTEVFDGLLAEINRQAIQEMDHFGVHAGVVSTSTRTLAFPGGSGAGKSTLVAACVEAGFEYVSDEALCLAYPAGEVVSYPKPLNFSRWSLEKLGIELPGAEPVSAARKTPVTVDHLGGAVATAPPGLSQVVFFERVPGPPRLEQVPPSRVVAGLLEFSFNHYRRPAEAFALTAQLARRCEGWALSYDDPRDAAGLMMTQFS
jgi:hypothetical protein